MNETGRDADLFDVAYLCTNLLDRWLLPFNLAGDFGNDRGSAVLK